MAKITLQQGKTYTYTGNLNKYTIIVGEVVDGGVVTPGVGVPTLRYGSGPPPSGVGNTGDVYIDTANSMLYTRGSTAWGVGVVFRGADGADGSSGTSGIDGQSPLSGYMTSDSHIVTGDNLGIVEDDLGGVGAQFTVFRGDSVVNDINFTASADGTSYAPTGTYAVHPCGVKAKISSSGNATFSKDGWASDRLYDTVTFYFKATVGTTSLVKSFKLIRTRGGRDAKSIRMSASRSSFTKDSTGNFSPEGQNIRFTADLQNYTAPAIPTWKVEVEDPTNPTGWVESLDVLEIVAPGDEAILTQSAFVAAVGSARVIRVTAIAPVADIDLDGVDDAPLTDSISVTALADGADGISPINGVLTNETHAVVANELGEVTDPMEEAGGYFQVFYDGNIVSNATYSVMDGTTEHTAIEGVPASLTKNGVKLTIDVDGRYSVAEDGGGWTTSGPNVITFTLRASGVNDLYVDKVFTLNRVKGGANAKIVYLTTDKQSFKKDSSGNYAPSTQTVTFSAQRQNIDASVSWSFETLYNGVWVPLPGLVAGSDYGSPSTSGSVDTFTLSNAQYQDLITVSLGVGDALRVKASSGDVYDEVTLITVADGEKGEQGSEGRKIISTDLIGLGLEPDSNESYGTIVGDLLLDVTNHKIYLRATSSSWVQQGSSYRGIDGVGGAALSAVLSNENHTVPANDIGVVRDDVLDGAGGQMYVYYGPVLVSATDYATSSFYVSTDGGSSWSPANTSVTKAGLVFVIGTNGAYNVSSSTVTFGNSSWALGAGVVSVLFKASVTSTVDMSPLVDGGATSTTEIVKSFTISKAAGGANAKILSIVSDGVSFTKGPTGDYFPDVQSIDFTALRQNLDGETLTWEAYRLEADWVLAWSSASPGDTPLLTISGDTASMDLEQFSAIVGSSTNDIAKVRVKYDTSTYDDQSVIVISDGVSPPSGMLTNETHTVIADSSGNVLDMNDPGGDFRVYEGGSELVTGVSYFVLNASNSPVNSYTNADGLTAAIDSTSGAYTITASGGSWDGPAKLASSFKFRAIKGLGTPSEISIDKMYSIGKALGGESAQYVRLSCDRNSFLFNADGTKPDSSAVATFTAETKNYPTSSHSVTWEVYIGATKKTPLSTYLTVSPSNDRIATMSISQFENVLSASSEVRIKALVIDADDTNGGEDSVTVVKTMNGADGAAPVNGYLTNESYTVIAENDGTLTADKFVGSAAPGQLAGTDGNFNVSIGTLPITSNLQFWIETGNPTNASGSSVGDYRIWTPAGGPTLKVHATNGSYFLTASSAGSWSTDSQNFTIVATSSNPAWGTSGPFKKVFSVAKSKGGASAQLVTVTSDIANFSKNATGLFANQIITWTAAVRNISASPEWKLYKIDSAGTETEVASSNYSTAAVGDGTYTLRLSSSFPAVNTSYPNFKVKATAGGLSDSWTVGVVSDGVGGVSGFLTNEVHNVSAGANGSYESGSLSSAGGTFVVMKGSEDQTAAGNYRFGIVGGADVSYNALTQKYSYTVNNLTMRINRTSGIYELSSPDGSGTSRWSADMTTFELFGSSSAGDGRVQKTYTISKNANKSIRITQPAQAQLDSTGASAANGTTVISVTAILTNCSSSNAPNWEVYNYRSSDATWQRLSTPATLGGWTVSSNTLSMTTTQFTINRGGNSTSGATTAYADGKLKVVARGDFGIYDEVEITGVKAGTAGSTAYGMSLVSDTNFFKINAVGDYDPTSQTITMTSNMQNLSGTNPNWVVYGVDSAGNETQLSPASSYLTVNTSNGKIASMTQAGFNSALTAGAYGSVKVYARGRNSNSVDYSDSLRFYKIQQGMGLLVGEYRLSGNTFIQPGTNVGVATELAGIYGNADYRHTKNYLQFSGSRITGIDGYVSLADGTYRHGATWNSSATATQTTWTRSAYGTGVSTGYTKFTISQAGTYEIKLVGGVTLDASGTGAVPFYAYLKSFLSEDPLSESTTSYVVSNVSPALFRISSSSDKTTFVIPDITSDVETLTHRYMLVVPSGGSKSFVVAMGRSQCIKESGTPKSLSVMLNSSTSDETIDFRIQVIKVK